MLAPRMLLPLTLLLALGCSGPAASRKPDPAPASGGSSAPRHGKEAPAAKATGGEASSVPEGAISREELMAYHKEGAQRFITKVRVKAAFRRGKFFGWRVLAYKGPGPIVQGDVIMEVIGMPIERPDQFMKVWEKLPAIKELTVKLLRQDKVQVLTYPVVDGARAMP